MKTYKLPHTGSEVAEKLALLEGNGDSLEIQAQKASVQAATESTDTDLTLTTKGYVDSHTHSDADASNSGFMSASDKLKLDGTNVAYGTCETSYSDGGKTVNVIYPTSGWSLQSGSRIIVKFTYTNMMDNPTLNVNNTGAKAIYYNGSKIGSSINNLNRAGDSSNYIEYVYDDTLESGNGGWVFIGWSKDEDTNTTYTPATLGFGYGTCSTAAATTTKTVNLSNYTLTTGGVVAVKFTNAVPASAKLNINGKGAKSIYYNGAAITANIIKAGDTGTFVYDGTTYVLISVDNAIEAKKLSGTNIHIDGVAFDGTKNISHYGFCQTISAAKEVTIEGFDLVGVAGSRVIVVFENGTTTGTSASEFTLNVSNTGAYPMMYKGTCIKTNMLQANTPYEFIFRQDDGGSFFYDLVGMPSLYLTESGGLVLQYQVNEDSQEAAIGSFASGWKAKASGTMSLAIGSSVTASGACSQATGTYTTASGNYSHAEGDMYYGTNEELKSLTLYDNTLDIYTRASGRGSHAEGIGTNSTKAGSHSEGILTISGGEGSHAEGCRTTANGTFAHAEGSLTSAYGQAAHAEGYDTKAQGGYSHAEGWRSEAQGTCAHAAGYDTLANNHNYAIGIGNKAPSLGSPSSSTIGDAFVIGNGVETVQGTQAMEIVMERSNAFRFAYNGNAYTDTSTGKWNSGSADYAEYFEWLDTNIANEDRRGYFVTLDCEKIKIAGPNDYILGIVSAHPAVVGNSPEEWHGRYLYDEFGTVLTEAFEYEKEVYDEKTGEMKLAKVTGTKRKENPDYDTSREYIHREDRPEWAAVGMLGVLPVRDDGTCQVNGYCTVAEGGIATAAETGYRVIKRVNDHVVKVIFR